MRPFTKLEDYKLYTIYVINMPAGYNSPCEGEHRIFIISINLWICSITHTTQTSLHCPKLLLPSSSSLSILTEGCFRGKANLRDSVIPLQGPLMLIAVASARHCTFLTGIFHYYLHHMWREQDTTVLGAVQPSRLGEVWNQTPRHRKARGNSQTQEKVTILIFQIGIWDMQRLSDIRKDNTECFCKDNMECFCKPVIIVTNLATNAP